ncbi:(deoxy)nucleoside triphosphate pyrophosphohydrolase [Corynebacterium sp. MSK044]|uniref:(deoxy)nucleoside triphosphate pyrophosphohydrolase n=1 Tax=unclassified Corynebacterium TaxID=2624378 RepID=UPI0025513DD5|nr:MULTISPECIES: (deoxy)nucleoside triphosphate pyrophosphohydrolase [unclassified Corynebacterium]MDK8794776.1 (deoxy)nucleoside triphosphate pyrophosphohydrolase [Corynebacterium sp. MSK041]MDK8798227.1 (deoxy)nucleoside triphosphate pyrophosphohydrolase [Corynebacterium sp. MSK044]
MPKLIGVTGAVILRNGTVFSARRGEGKALAGKWEFPGGKIEAGETPEESLARELKEELLVDATVGNHITTTEYEYDFGSVRLSTFYCSLPADTEPTRTEHAESRWVPIADATVEQRRSGFPGQNRRRIPADAN